MSFRIAVPTNLTSPARRKQIPERSAARAAAGEGAHFVVS